MVAAAVGNDVTASKNPGTSVHTHEMLQHRTYSNGARTVAVISLAIGVYQVWQAAVGDLVRLRYRVQSFSPRCVVDVVTTLSVRTRTLGGASTVHTTDSSPRIGPCACSNDEYACLVCIRYKTMRCLRGCIPRPQPTVSSCSRWRI